MIIIQVMIQNQKLWMHLNVETENYMGSNM